LVALLLVGFALRVVALGRVPFGFHPDEGHNALDAWAVVGGARPVFFEGNNGREPLFLYVMALVLAAVGPSIWSSRLAAAFLGTLYLAAQHTLVRSLPLPRPRAVALASTAVAAVTFWPVAQSRYALRAVLLPTFVALALWAWWRTLDAGAPRRASVAMALRWPAAAGLFLAAGLYTHLAGRLLPLALAAAAAWAAWRDGSRRPLAALAAASAVALVLSAPLLAYFARRPDMLIYRADQVSLFDPAVRGSGLWQAVWTNARHLLAAPFVRGDVSPYHNLPRLPVFDPPMAVAFGLGACLAAADLAGRRGRRRQRAAALGALALGAMVAPSLLSIGAPNYVRLTGTWPVLFTLAGWGLVTAGAAVDRAWKTEPRAAGRSASRALGAAGATAVGLLLAVSALVTVRDYFGLYARDPETYDAFNGAAAERGAILAGLAAADRVYVSPAIWRQAVIRFLCLGSDVSAVDASTGLVLPAKGRVLYAFEASEEEAAHGVAARWPWLSQSVVTNTHGAPALRLLAADASVATSIVPWTAAAGPHSSFGGRWSLAGAWPSPAAVSPGGTLALTLVWSVARPSGTDLNLFVHLLSGDGRSLGQWDGPPLGGSYGTDHWQPGETVLQTVGVKVVPDAAVGTEGVVEAGWYDWRDGQRLPVSGTPDNAVRVATFRVAAAGH
jgi:hypothetical protein